MPSTSAIGKLVEAADVHGGDHQASNRSVIGPDEHGRVYHQNAFGYGGHKQDERVCVVVEGVRAPSPSGERAVRHSGKFPNAHVAPWCHLSAKSICFSMRPRECSVVPLFGKKPCDISKRCRPPPVLSPTIAHTIR
jgi:hypothetical protein